MIAALFDFDNDGAMSDWDESRVEHHEAKLPEVRLHYAAMGPEDGPLVVLLHGFPEFWYSWRHQMGPLADAGYRVVAPDMRGYNISEKPAGVAAYRTPKLTGDVAALIRHLGRESAVVGGHDWGAVVAWLFAQEYPELLVKLVIMNVPHPVAFRSRFFQGWQFLKSWYVFAFQVPWMVEIVAKITGFYTFRHIFRNDPVNPMAFSEEDIRRYMEALRQPGALTAAVNYYRAAFRDMLMGRLPPPKVIERPVLVLWGERDAYLGRHLAEPPAEWVPDCRLVRFPDASHWVQVDVADDVNASMLDFLDLV